MPTAAPSRPAGDPGSGQDPDPALRATSPWASYRAALSDRAVTWLAVLLLACYVATPGVFEGKMSGDGLINFLYLPSLLVHRTANMQPARLASGSPWALPVVAGQE